MIDGNMRTQVINQASAKLTACISRIRFGYGFFYFFSTQPAHLLHQLFRRLISTGCRQSHEDERGHKTDYAKHKFYGEHSAESYARFERASRQFIPGE